MAAVKEKVASGKVVRPAPTRIAGSKNKLATLIRAPYFVVEHYEVKEPQGFETLDASGKSSVQILVVVEGCGIIEAPGMEKVRKAKYDLDQNEVKPYLQLDKLRDAIHWVAG